MFDLLKECKLVKNLQIAQSALNNWDTENKVKIETVKKNGGDWEIAELFAQLVNLEANVKQAKRAAQQCNNNICKHYSECTRQ